MPSTAQLQELLMFCFHCDHILQIFPNAIAQAVYTAFVHAFPASWNSFDDGFKADLCKTVALWQSGKFTYSGTSKPLYP